MVLHADDGPRGAIALGKTPIHAGDDAANDQLLAVAHLAIKNLRDRGINLRVEGFLKAVERVAGDVEAQHLTLQGQLVLAIPLLIRDVDGERGDGLALLLAAAEASEEIELAFVRCLLGGLHRVHRVLVDEHEPLARVPQGVESAGLDEGFGHALGTGGQLDLVQVVGEGSVRALLATGLHDGIDHFPTHVADSAHAEANILAHSLKRFLGLIDIRGQHADAQVTAVGEIDSGLVLLIAHGGQQRGHVLRRVVGLEVGRPEGHQTVAGGVGLVERVGREGLDGAPQCVHGLLGVAVVLHAAPELVVLLRQDFRLLLTHGLTEAICLAGGVVGHLLRDTHDLLLVDDEAVGLIQDLLERLLQLRVNRSDFLAAVLAVRVVPVGVHTHRARAVECQRRHNIFKARRLHALEQLLHTAGVQLENAQRIAAGEQVVDLGGIGVVGVEVLQVDFLAAVLLDVFQAVTNHGEVTQAQKVHLQQADGLARRIIPAGDVGAIGGALPHGDVVHEAHRGHNHRTGVHAGLPDHALQAAGGLVDLLDVRIRLNHLADLGGLRVAGVIRVGDAGERDVLRHDGRRQGAVDAVRHLEAGLAKVHLGGVLNGLLGLHGAEGNHLRHLVLAPAIRGVGDHLAAAAVVEVDIDIRGGRALRVQESLEEEIVLNRVDVGNGQRVGHEGAGGRTTARTDADSDGAGMLDELGHDEEVGRVALHLNNGDFVLGALNVLLRHLPAREAVLEALHDLVGEPRGGRVALRHIRNRHAVVGVLLPDLAVVLDAFCDPQGVVAGLRNHLVPYLAHLLGGLDVVAGAAELEAIRVHEGLAGLHAQHGLVGRRLGFQHIVAVIGHQRRQVQLAADLQQAVAGALLNIQAVVHQLQEEVVLAVDVLPHGSCLEGLIKLPQAQAGLDVSRGATGGGDDALRMLRDELGVHTRPLTQLSLVGGQGGQLEQVVQAGGVFRQHGLVQVRAGGGDVVALLVRGAPQHALLIEAGFRRHVGLDADDGLDPRARHLLVEGVGAVHISVVRHAHGGHALAHHLIGQHIHLGHAVQHGKFGVVVQVDEG